MDPNAALDKIRGSIKKVDNEPPHSEDVIAYMQDAISAFEDLDKWIQSGGFLPRDWQKPVDAVGKKL